MLTSNRRVYSSKLGLWIGLAGSIAGLAVGFFAGVQPLYPALLMGSVGIVLCLFKDPEKTVIGLLILRSALDPFSAQQAPAAFALGLDALTVLYVLAMVLTRRKVHTDGFWWFFAGWVAFQGLWVILLPLGGLGMNGSFVPTSLREWLRLFSWLIAYLLVMQLKDTTSPQKLISWMFLGLVIPLSVAGLQLFAPSLIPPVLTGTSGEMASPVETFSRVRGTLGLANTFATFLLLFILLTWWKLKLTSWRLPWIVLLGSLVFLLVNTQSLFSLIMMAIAIFVVIAPQIRMVNLIGSVVLLATVISLFASSEFGQERLASVANTPLFNRDMDISRAVLLSQGDNNSFNWRLAQWTFLLQAWQQYPIWGYGLLTCSKLTVLHNYAHNEYVRALVEGGIVGLIAFLVFLGAQMWRLIQLFQQADRGSAKQDFCLAMLAMLFATMVGMITENIWTHTTLFFYWWTFFAVAGWNWGESRTSIGSEFGNRLPKLNS